jgi:S1-C subfamily serine protease
MDTAAASSGTAGASLGFAIPSDTVKTVASEIMAHRALPGLVYGRAPFLGIEVVDSSQIGSGLNPFGPFGNPLGFGYGFGPIANTPNGTQGVIVSAVDPGSPAEAAGIQPGDVITEIDGEATTSTTALSKAIDAHHPGDNISIVLSTSDGTRTVVVKLVGGPID